MPGFLLKTDLHLCHCRAKIYADLFFHPLEVRDKGFGCYKGLALIFI